MKFEEQFPSLKDKILLNKTTVMLKGEAIEEHDYSKCLTSHIQEHCLDKQKVRQAIKKVEMKDDGDDSRMGMLYIEELKKELELGDKSNGKKSRTTKID